MRRYKQIDITTGGFSLHLKTLLILSFAAFSASAQTIELDATSEDLAARAAEVQALPALDEELRKRILDMYSQASDALSRAKEWQTKIEAFEKAISEAPTMQADVETDFAEADSVVDIPDQNVPLAELELQFVLAQTDLTRYRDEMVALQAEPSRRMERRRTVPELLSNARSRLQAIQVEMATAPNLDEHESLRSAHQSALQLREQNRQLEIKSYELELQSYEVRNQLLPQRITLSTRRASQQEALLKSLSSLLNNRRELDARNAATATKQTRIELTNYSGTVLEQLEALLRENKRLNELRTGPEGLLSKIRATEEEMNTLSKDLDDLNNGMNRAKQRVSAAGSSSVVGLVLRQQADRLPNTRIHIRNVRQRKNIISAVQIEQIELREQWLDMLDVERTANAEADAILFENQIKSEDEFVALISSILDARRATLETLLKDYDSYFNRLLDVNARENELIGLTREYSDYITERVLFIKSGHFPDIDTLRSAKEALFWFLNPNIWAQTLRGLKESTTRQPASYVILLLGMGLTLGFRPRLKKMLTRSGDAAAKKSCTSIAPTIVSIWSTALLSAPVPLSLFLIGLACSNSLLENDHDRAMGGALIYVSGILFAAIVISDGLRPKGLAIAHFSWPKELALNLRKLMRIATPSLMVTLFIALLMDVMGNESWKESAGRLAYVTSGIIYLYFAVRFFSTHTNYFVMVLQNLKMTSGRSAVVSGRLFFIIIPLVLLVAALAGYYYTAHRISSRMFISVGAVLLTIFLCSLVYRWLLLVRRRVAISQKKQHRELTKSQDGSSSETVEQMEADWVDLDVVDAQNERLIRGVAIAVSFMMLIVIWADMDPAFDILDRVEIASSYQMVPKTITTVDDIVRTEYVEQLVPITLKHVAIAIAILIITLFATRNIPGVLELLVLQRIHLAAGERFAITSIIRYLLIALGVSWAFSAVGIGWGRVQWLVAALGLGLGFGLQEIFANFMSGLILLFERPIRIGDTVTVGGIHGTVTKIRIRATTITSFDRKELVVPNKEFITSQLVNWTLSDSVLRVVIPVGVSYSSDVELVRKTLLEVATSNPTVLRDPEPLALFLGFGDNTLNFELRIHCGKMEDYIPLRHQMHMMVINAFRAKGIEIAFPQRDLHIKTADAPIQIIQERERNDKS